MSTALDRRFSGLMRRAGRDRDVSRAILAVLRADSRVARSLEEALAPAGLSVAKFTILMELAAGDGPGLALCDIGRRLLKSAPNVSGLIDRMVTDGLIERRRGERDRRIVTASITEKGWEALERAAPAALSTEKRLTAALDRDQLVMLAELLDALGPRS